MSNSWQILTDVIESVEAYQQANLTDYDFLFERYAQDDNELDARSNIQNVRIGFYEVSSDNAILVSSGIAYDVNQSYEFSIFVKVGREQDYGEDVEKCLMDVKDMLNDWLKVTSIPTITSSQLFKMTYTDSSQIQRTPSYASMTLNVVAYRNLNTL